MISDAMLRDALQGLPAKVLLFLDTCHAENLLGQARTRNLPGVRRAIQEVKEAGRALIVLGAAMPWQASLESGLPQAPLPPRRPGKGHSRPPCAAFTQRLRLVQVPAVASTHGTLYLEGGRARTRPPFRRGVAPALLSGAGFTSSAAGCPPPSS